MKNFLEKILPNDHKKRKWISVAITIVISGVLTALGIYGIGEYGIALFILTPLFLGACSTMLYGFKKEISQKEAWKISSLTLSIFMGILFLCAMEGLICIAMATPFVLLFTWLGTVIGHTLITKAPDNTPISLFILISIIPSMSFIEKEFAPTLSSVTTSIEINADPNRVWKNIVEFPQLDEPNEFIFKTGIAYPINASIEGTGVGAIRHCNFSTGSFVEPITIWDEPNLLKFDVLQQPTPMKELSIWDINAPHLHDYFVSKQGQFKLTQLANGNTLVEGTTWYYNDIKPAFYWQIWSDPIIHKIHNRVLEHIKINSELEIEHKI